MAVDASTTSRADGSRWFRPPMGVVRTFYGALAALLGYTLVAQSLLTLHQHRSLVNTFSYFTIQSNVLVLCTAIVLCLRPTASGAPWRCLRLGALCGITVTGIVYATAIAPYVHLSGWALVYDYVFHYVVPLAAVVGFVFVGPRLALHRQDMAFLVWPVVWLAYTMIRAAVSNPGFAGFGEAPSRYPYRFLDIDQVSVGEVIGAIVIITALLTGLGLAYIWVESRLGGSRR